MEFQLNALQDQFVQNTQIISDEDRGIASHQVASIACARNHMYTEITLHSLEMQQYIRDYINRISKEVAEEVIMAQITLHV